MNRLRTLLLVAFVAAVMVAGGLRVAGAGRDTVPVGPGTAAASAAIDFAPGDIATVQAGSVARTLTLTGTLRPLEQALVRAKVAGEVREITVREGMSVRRGERIARIDTTELELRLAERDAQWRSAQLQLAQARRTLAHQQQLFERGFISRSALDAARSTHDLAAAADEAAAAQLKLARKSAADATVHAPIDGIVAERFAQVGERVAVDGRLLSIVDLSRMEIEAPVPASEIGAVRIGQKVRLQIEGIEQPQIGEVARIAPGTQPGTRSVPVYVALTNRDPAVRAGMFASGRLEVAARQAAATIPAAAVHERGERRFVYVIEGERLVEREVTLGLRGESRREANGGDAVVEVVSGLSAGERIVAVRLGPLRDGSQVRVMPRN